MKKAEQSKWEPTEHPMIFHSADQDYIKIFARNSSGSSYQSKEQNTDDYNI